MRHCLTSPWSVRARLDELCHIIEHLDEFPNDLEIPVIEYDTDEGYAAWAPAYDTPNPAVAVSRSVVAEASPAPGQASRLDAACGTGAQAEQLVDAFGYEVIGVDASEAMLAVARAKLPSARFEQGRLQSLPLDDESVDVVTCSLALTHVAELGPVIAEMARVLRPGGAVVLADMNPFVVTLGGAATFPSGEGFQLPFVRNLVHSTEAYVTAAVAAGLIVSECREPVVTEDVITTNPAYGFVPHAVRQAFEGLPFLIAVALHQAGLIAGIVGFGGPTTAVSSW